MAHQVRLRTLGSPAAKRTISLLGAVIFVAILTGCGSAGRGKAPSRRTAISATTAESNNPASIVLKAPAARTLPLANGMKVTYNRSVLNRQLADTGGPHEYSADMTVQGPLGETARKLMRHEMALLTHAGWTYTGTVGGNRDHQAQLVPVGTLEAVSYSYDQADAICAALQIDGSAKAAADTDVRPDLAVDLSHDRGEVECSLPNAFR